MSTDTSGSGFNAGQTHEVHIMQKGTLNVKTDGTGLAVDEEDGADGSDMLNVSPGTEEGDRGDEMAEETRTVSAFVGDGGGGGGGGGGGPGPTDPDPTTSTASTTLDPLN